MASTFQLPIGTPEPQVLLEIEGKPIDFLLDTGATFSVLLSKLGTLSNRCVTIRGVTGKPVTKYFSQPLRCLWNDLLFSHSFLVMPESPTPLLGRDLMTKLGAIVILVPGQIPNCLPVTEPDINPEV